MSDFEDIDAGRLIYTCNCGWVDLGHANPVKTKRPNIGAIALWEQVESESGPRSEYDNGYLVTYTQDMRKWGVGVSETGQYFVQYGLAPATKRAIALAIFQELSLRFETMQGRFPFRIRSGPSSFSQEDLVSNLIGFYRALHPKTDFLAVCRPVSKEASKKVWTATGAVSAIKNQTFLPVFHSCFDCKGTPKFPEALQKIEPAEKAKRSTPPTKGVNFRDWQFVHDQKREFEMMMIRARYSRPPI
jgi:hypothetical protein